MSHDFPFYEELRRRHHPARWWWIAGDRLYYLGFLPALIALVAIPMSLYTQFQSGRELISLSGLLMVIAIGIPAAFLGTKLKDRAYQLAERDGITIERTNKRNDSNSQDITS